MWMRILAPVFLGLGLWGAAMADPAMIDPAKADPAGFVDDFKSIDTGWHVADYRFTHPMFDTDWSAGQIGLDKGLTLSLDPQKGQANRFVGGSIRREEVSHFGRYEVTLRAARGAGLVTGFFTYTGPHYGTRHDEIDIEFLGRDTTQLHAAWFVDGELTEHFIDLGFDAAARMETYAFEWYPDRLRWFAGERLIFEHHAADGAIPTVPGRLFLNLWAADPSIANWAGTTPEGQAGKAVVTDVRFQPFAPTGPSVQK
tara:strand:- start:602 stop:1369 length:768 start_codon:yes stop_codon:yes gene_type:complete